MPVLTPRLSSLWIQLVTPVTHRIARPLVEGLRNRVVCGDDEAQRLMPHALYGVREAVGRALREAEGQRVDTHWRDVGPIPGDPAWAGGTVCIDARESTVSAPAATVYGVLNRLGGAPGGTVRTGCGAGAPRSITSSAGPVCGGVGATPSDWHTATPWTSGA